VATQEVEIRRIAVWSQPGQIVHETLSWKNTSQKRASGVAQGVGPEFKPQYHHQKKKKKNYENIPQCHGAIPVLRVCSGQMTTFICPLCVHVNVEPKLETGQTYISWLWITCSGNTQKFKGTRFWYILQRA
jgi:hypothetical protein